MVNVYFGKVVFVLAIARHDHPAHHFFDILDNKFTVYSQAVNAVFTRKPFKVYDTLTSVQSGH